MSMKDFLASGGAAVKAYKNKGVVPSYVAQPKGSMSTKRMANKPMQSSPFKKKKKTAPVKKKTYSGM